MPYILNIPLPISLSNVELPILFLIPLYIKNPYPELISGGIILRIYHADVFSQ